MPSWFASAIAVLLVLQSGDYATPTLSNADLEFEKLERDRQAQARAFDTGAIDVALQLARREIVREYLKRRLSMSRGRAARCALAVARKQPFVRAATLTAGTIRYELTFGKASGAITLRRLEEKDPL